MITTPNTLSRPGTSTRRSGFTLVELVLVLVIAGVLAAIVVPPAGEYLQQRSLVNARDAVAAMASRARALAVQQGDIVKLRVSPDTERVTVLSFDETETLETLDLSDGDIRADLTAAQEITVCYVAGGYADPGCSSGVPGTIGVSNSKGTLSFDLNGAGQVQW